MDRTMMLESVKGYLSQFGEVGAGEKRILRAMRVVNRENFVNENYKKYAYFDKALPIEGGQTISQPSTVARMIQILELRSGDSVLEIGTGSGWNSALIGFLVGEGGKVLSLEIVNFLVDKAKRVIKEFGIKNVEVKKEDFRKIGEMKFDRIIFTAGILQGQENIIRDYANEHLREEGILVCPHRSGRLILFEKTDKGIKEIWTNDEYVFVKLVL